MMGRSCCVPHGRPVCIDRALHVRLDVPRLFSSSSVSAVRDRIDR
jgi:hypothetical protein